MEPANQEKDMAQSAALTILNKKKEAAESPPSTAEEATVTAGDPVADEPVSVGDQLDADTEAQAAKPKPKKISSKTAKSEPATGTSTAPKTAKLADEISDTSAIIEGLTETAAFKQLDEMLHAQSYDEFRMGGILSKIQTEGWFGEHPNFRTLIEAEFGIQYRRAMMWVAMYNNLVESGVSYAKLKRLGWTKISLIAPVVTQDNVDEMLKSIDGLSALQIGEYVKGIEAGTASTSSVPADVNDLKSKTFKLFPGQKESVELAIDKAKKESGTDSDAAALEFICVDFAAGTKKKSSSATASKTVTEVKVPETKDEFVTVFQSVRENSADLQSALTLILEAINGVFPEAQIEVTLEETA